MKTLKSQIYFALIMVVVSFGIGCKDVAKSSLLEASMIVGSSHEGQEVQAQFSITTTAAGEKRSTSTHTNNANQSQTDAMPTFAIVTLTDSKGVTTYEKKQLKLYNFSQKYLTESLPLKAGEYQLQDFFIIGNDNKIMYAAPKKGSDYARFVTAPIPISLSAAKDRINKVIIEVVEVKDQSPLLWGYVSFTFTPISIIDFLISVQAFDKQAGNWAQVDAVISVTKGSEILYSETVPAETSRISIKETDAMTVKVSKAGYKTFTNVMTAADIKQYQNMPLVVILEEERYKTDWNPMGLRQVAPYAIDSFTVMWDKMENAVKYNVYAQENKRTTIIILIATTSDNFFRINTARDGVLSVEPKYQRIFVVPVDASGNEIPVANNALICPFLFDESNEPIAIDYADDFNDGQIDETHYKFWHNYGQFSENNGVIASSISTIDSYPKLQMVLKPGPWNIVEVNLRMYVNKPNPYGYSAITFDWQNPYFSIAEGQAIRQEEIFTIYHDAWMNQVYGIEMGEFFCSVSPEGTRFRDKTSNDETWGRFFNIKYVVNRTAKTVQLSKDGVTYDFATGNDYFLGEYLIISANCYAWWTGAEMRIDDISILYR